MLSAAQYRDHVRERLGRWGIWWGGMAAAAGAAGAVAYRSWPSHQLTMPPWQDLWVPALAVLVVEGARRVYRWPRAAYDVHREVEERAEHAEARVAQLERRHHARESIARLLADLSSYEKEAFRGGNGGRYAVMLQHIKDVKKRVKRISDEYLDDSLDARFNAVNPLDVEFDDATKLHFLTMADGGEWDAVYHQLRGWRLLLRDVLGELGRQIPSTRQADTE